MIKTNESKVKTTKLPSLNINLNLNLKIVELSLTYTSDKSVQICMIPESKDTFYITNFELFEDENNEKYFILASNKIYLKDFE